MGKQEQLSTAIKIATDYHSGQVDKGGLPYILHPLTVMNNVETIEEKIVAILHDIIEDTPMTKDMLFKLGISEEIVEAIDVISKKKGQTYDEYLELVRDNELARRVKIADLKHNMDLSRLNREITDKDLNRQEKYKKASIYLGSEEDDFKVICPVCGSKEYTIHEEYDYDNEGISCGVGNYYLRCCNCGHNNLNYSYYSVTFITN